MSSLLRERCDKSFPAILRDVREKLSFSYMIDFMNDYEIFQVRYSEEMKNIHGRLEFLFRMMQAQNKKKKKA